MTGHLAGEELSRAYASSDLFVNPSVTETFGNVTLEAMPSGVPPVCVDATGSASLVEHERTGMLAGGPDGHLLAEAAMLLIASRERRAAIGSVARRASVRYDWNDVLDGVIDTYVSVMSEPAPLVGASSRMVA